MILAHEISITGSWLITDGEIKKDQNCQRIDWLVNNYLIKLANSALWGDWEILYKDPTDSRYWELSFPNSNLHGGGPPALQLISESAAKKKYSID